VRYGAPRVFPAAALAGLVAQGVLWASIDAIFFAALGVAAPALSAAIAVLLLLPLLPLVAGLEQRARTWLALALALSSALGVGAVAVLG